MTLRYIFHSGFLLETEQSILIFDYWIDPANVVESFIYPSGSKHVYVFASHFHEDHFNKDIFKWRQNNPFSDYTYILSKDILKRKRAQKEDADLWMAKGSDDMPAHAKSTLCGVSLSIPITKGRLNLGTWQGIYLCEFRDYGGERRIVATIIGE